MVSRKEPVHIQIKGRDSSCNIIYTKRVHGRIYINNPGKKTGLFPYASCEFIANILTLKLISMDSCNNCYPFIIFFQFNSLSPIRHESVF